MQQSSPSPTTPPRPVRVSTETNSSFHPVVEEELGHLARTRQLLEENPEGPQASETEVVGELMRLQEEFREAKEEDKGSIQQQLNALAARLDALRNGRQTEKVDPDSPYFAHLQLEEDGRRRDIFLGRATRLGHGLRIVDWRNAPISKLFYRYQEGDEYYEEFAERWHEGIVSARRSLHVREGELLRVDGGNGTWIREGTDWRTLDRDRPRLAGGEGVSLRQGKTKSARLGAGVQLRKDKHLPDIAALIDPEQFELITQSPEGVVVLRGSAGSGKTTVALHRIAYLSFALGPRRFPHKNVLVVVWGRAMRDYVAHVLPALGIKGVKVTTWTKWSVETMVRHFPDLPRTIAEDTPEPVVRMKLHPGVSEALETVIARNPGPARPEQAIEDWARLITDPTLLSRAMGDDISLAALSRALRWNVSQVENVMAWVEGDHEVDARLDAEDAALLLRAWQLRVGSLKRPGGRKLQYAHVVLDEVQDFSPVEVQVLLGACDKNQSVTLAGDTRQHISQNAGFASWQEFLDRIGVPSTALATLEVSYRSTHPVIRFALDVLDDPSQPPPRTTRNGPPVEFFPFSDHGACVAFLTEELTRLVHREPLANIAVLTPSEAMSELYFDGLSRADVPGVRLVHEQRFAFAPGIDVGEAAQVKGLEFDYVVIVEASARFWPDTPHHRRLLHVAATRAVHQLWVTTVGTASPILPRSPA